MNSLGIHPSAQAAWTIANYEACQSGGSQIDPEHFFLAILKIIDDAFHQEAAAMNVSADALQSIAALAPPCREILGMSANDVTTLRRHVWRTLRMRGEPLPLHWLHRSDASRHLFQEAAERALDAGSGELSLPHLLQALLDNPSSVVQALLKRESPAQQTEPARAAPRSTNPAAETAVAKAPKSQRIKTPALDELGRDLTALAREGRLAPVVGRKGEMTTLARYLQRTAKRNAILIGEAGVGKTAVVEGLAQRLVAVNAPPFLRALRIVQVSVADLVAGTKYRGDLERRVQKLLAEAAADPDVILFFDEIHLAMKAGAGGEAPMDLANLLKPALAREDFRCIGATTTEEFERHVKNDAAFMRRFQVLRIGEPSTDEALHICREWARRIEGIQQVTFQPEGIAAAVDLSARFMPGRQLPDKAIDLLENAAAFVKVSSLSFSSAVPTKQPPPVGRREIEAVLEEQYGISVHRAEILSSARVQAVLQGELVGQDEAIADLVEALAALTLKPGDARRPLGIFLFAGPTGVGKTMTAECLGRSLFDPEGRDVGRFNMSEYKERHELARLTGAPPGFVGHEQSGALFQFTQSHPEGLILLDEMEKAHPEIQDYFLQVFDKGEARDSRGRLVSFQRHLFILSCNVGTSAPRAIDFGNGKHTGETSRAENIQEDLAKHFRREFLGRLDRVIAFRPLTEKSYQTLFDRRTAALAAQVAQQNRVRLEWNENLKKDFTALCQQQEDGARGFVRLFDHCLAVPLFSRLRDGPQDAVLHIQWADGRVVFVGAERL